MSTTAKSDPLIAPHTWPGCRLGYMIIRDSDGRANLRVIVQFDPARVSMRRKAKLAVWTSIRRQAKNPSFQIAVVFSLRGDTGPGHADISYRGLVEKLFRGMMQGRHVPTTAVLNFPLDGGAVAANGEALVPLLVVLAISRKRGFADEGQQTIREQVSSAIAPWLSSTTGRPASLVSWGRRAETALVGYDGAGGRIRLLRPAYRSELATGLWALRWGGAHGIRMTPGDPPAIAFAARPFAKELLSGPTTATTWDDRLKPEITVHSYDDVDVDAAFDRVVAVLNDLAISDRVATIGRLVSSMPSRIQAARVAAVRMSARRLISIRTGHNEADALLDVQRSVEHAVLLEASKSKSTWAHLRLSVSANAVRFRFGGAMSGVPSRSNARSFQVDLPRPGTADGMDFALAPTLEGQDAVLALQPRWTLSEVECLEETEDVALGGRLVPLLRAANGEGTDLSFGNLEVPVTSSLFPQLPVLVRYEAQGSDDVAGQTLAELMAKATRWSLSFTVDCRQLHSLDHVWFSLAFNRRPDGSSRSTHGTEELTPLASGLLRFDTGYSSVAHLLRQDSVEDPVRDTALARITTELADDLIDVLNVLDIPPRRDEAAFGVDDTATWVLRNRPNADGSHSLFIRGERPCFPKIAGCAPSDRGPANDHRAPDAGVWHEATYHLPEGAVGGSISFVLDQLDLLSRQTASVVTRVVRNAGFGLDPLLVRETGWVPLGPTVMPAIDLAMPLSASSDGSSLSLSLETTLRPFCDVAGRAEGESTLRVDLNYSYPLTSTNVELDVIGTMPIVSAAFHLSGDSPPAKIAASLVVACQSWADEFAPLHPHGRLSLCAVLDVDFMGTLTPLLAIRQLDLPWRLTP